MARPANAWDVTPSDAGPPVADGRRFDRQRSAGEGLETVYGAWIMWPGIGPGALVLGLLSTPAFIALALLVGNTDGIPLFLSLPVAALFGFVFSGAAVQTFRRDRNPAHGHSRMLLPPRLGNRTDAVALAASALAAAGIEARPVQFRLVVRWALSPQLPKSHLELVYVEWSGGGKDGGARVPPRFDIYGRGMEHLDRYLRLKKELLAAVNAARGPSSAP